MAPKRVTKKKVRAVASKAKSSADIFKDDIDTEIVWDQFKSRFIPTGFPYFDNVILKTGGIPTKRITEIYGDEGSCKSLLTLRIIANTQRADPLKRKFLLVDSEFTFDPDWAVLQGVDLDRLIVKSTNIAEEIFDNYVIPGVESGQLCGVALDSLGNTETLTRSVGKRFVYDKNTGVVNDDAPMVLAKIFTAYVKRIPKAIAEHDIPFIVVNQIRDGLASYGAFINTPGGRCYKHNRSLAIQLRKIEDIENPSTGEAEGIIVRANLTKYKLGVKNTTVAGKDLRFFFEGGEEKARIYDTYNLLIDSGLLVQTGPWFRLAKMDKKWQGMAKVLESLKDEDFFAEVESLLKEVEIVQPESPYDQDIDEIEEAEVDAE